MLTDILVNIGEFIFEHSELILGIGFILLALSLIAQVVINGSMEEEISELHERLESVEKAVGTQNNEGVSDKKNEAKGG